MFDWLLKRKRPVVVHTDVGPLKQERGYWSGECEFAPTGTKVSLFVDDAGGEPVANALMVVREFGQRYPGLKAALARELRDLVSPWHRELWGEHSVLEEGDQLLARFELGAIHVDSTGFPVAEFSLKEGWDDAGFRVSLEDWTPRGLGVDD